MTGLPRGECPVCGRDVALRIGGLVREHGIPVCDGSGRPVRSRDDVATSIRFLGWASRGDFSRRRCPVDGVELVPYWSNPESENYVVIRRGDVTYCSPRCRQAASRARRGLRHGWGGTTDRQARRARVAAAVPVTGP